MSTILLKALLIGSALLPGADPDTAQPATADQPAEQVQPEKADETAKTSDSEATDEEAPADQDQSNAESAGEAAPADASVDRPSASGVPVGNRVGAFWFVTIGK